MAGLPLSDGRANMNGANPGNLNTQFIGQARLTRLLLWKIGNSTDADTCFNEARNRNMLTEEDIEFLNRCLDAEEQARDSDDLPLEPSQEMLAHLRRCANKLNSADCA